ncbi:MAG: phospho-sugar mutase [Oscillospiraceae bacterium]|nr:phospho-sugar mutase [Oscillospiraceae bacterium]
MSNWRETYQSWLDSPSLSETEWAELNAIRDNDKEIEDRFFAPLAFGTAGLRGVMGLGTNRMNVHVIRHATQAFAQVIAECGREAMERGVVICRDCRLNGEEYAREAACVMAANGIHVRLFESLRPTPELSFAIRYYKAQAGINVTASHNPKEYNGYKVYWDDGAQLPPREAAEIAAIMEQSDVFTAPRRMAYEEALEKGLIEIIGAETDEAYLECVCAQAINRETVAAVADELKIVFTPFHGCGWQLVPEALKRLGIKHLYPVQEQMVIDGAFPTVKSPNPENPEGFYLAVELAKEVGSDLIIGTDPDSDRVGVLVRRGDEFVPITGNQMGVLLLDYIYTARKATGTLPAHPAALTTIVSTSMVRAVCEKNGIQFEETFTGFKFIAEKLAEYAENGNYYEYILGFEESYGYMMGDFVRDKDAVTASMMIAEMAAYWHAQGKTLLDAMEALYEKYGYYAEKTVNLFMYGVDGLREMQALMASLRTDPPAQMAGTNVARVRDYQSGDIIIPGVGVVEKTPISGSNVLYFELSDGSDLVVRPSGTEPKVKIYVLARGENAADCNARRDRYAEFAQHMAN